MTSIIIGLVVPLIIWLVLSRVIKANEKAESLMDENSFVLRQPSIFTWVGIIDMLLFGAFAFIAAVFGDASGIWAVIGLFCFFMLGAYITAYCLFWRVEVNGDNISCEALFKPRSAFTFDDITFVKIKSTANPKAILYSGAKKLLVLEPTCKGYSFFLSVLERKQIEFQ